MHFLSDSFPAQYLQPSFISLYALDRFRHNGKVQLRGKPYGANHPQRVVRVGNVRIQRCAKQAFLKVRNSAERVYKIAVILFLQGECKGVDSKVPALLVILQCTVFHNRLAGIAVVGFLPCSHELYLISAVPKHCGTEVLEHAHLAVDFLSHGLGYLYSAAFHNYVYIVPRPLEEAVTDKAADYKGSHPVFRGSF